VLEYLGVPHDQPLKAKKATPMLTAKDVAEDGPSDSTADLTAMFDDANNLPADDPLRNPAAANGAAQAANTETSIGEKKDNPGPLSSLSPKVLTAFKASGGTTSAMPDAADRTSARTEPAKSQPETQAKNGKDILVDAGKRVAVPSFAGAGLRGAIERADAVGLRVKPVGSGLAREQVPAAGTMVPSGMEIVVRFTR
jgi:cell division protein FtsI (penicillin-binding protein 3)